MSADLAVLRVSLANGYLPPAITQAEPDKLKRISAALTLEHMEGREAIEDMARIRELLVTIGALAGGDTATGTADLVELLLWSGGG